MMPATTMETDIRLREIAKDDPDEAIRTLAKALLLIINYLDRKESDVLSILETKDVQKEE